MDKIRKLTGALLITVLLLSGQVLAGNSGHKYYPVPSPDSVLRHNADSDAIRARAMDAVEECHSRQRISHALR